jgi:adenine-specific DNA-methyltransferase
MSNAIDTESLTAFAARQQREYEEATTPARRRTAGHFGTPGSIAEFMAGMPPRLPAGRIRILDAGAGVGTLAAAVCERIASLTATRTVEIDAWENDAGLVPFLRRTLERSRVVLEADGHRLDFTIHRRDFVLENAPRAKDLFDHDTAEGGYHLAIMNPPYFKLRKESEQARAMASVVHGQPNIYTLFMAVACNMLAEGGDLVAITPRSYFNGPYFRRFRRWFFRRMTVRQIHLFQSRTEAFREAKVLQESVILWARKGAERSEVLVTTSEGRELSHGVERRMLPYPVVVDQSNADVTIRVPAGQLDEAAIELVDALPSRFCHLGLQISTGPVVTFRATGHLLSERAAGDGSAPLVMMHNVRPFVTELAGRHNGKPSHFQVSVASRPLLLPARRFVLLKRFTAKEERRRLVAGVFEQRDSYSPWIAIENHVNYVCKPDGELSRDEALGLAALFNSALFDRYFRAISGSTQVNAAEIRSLPLPHWPAIRQIGHEIAAADRRDLVEVEAIVSDVLGVNSRLGSYLAEF